MIYTRFAYGRKLEFVSFVLVVVLLFEVYAYELQKVGIKYKWELRGELRYFNWPALLYAPPR